MDLHVFVRFHASAGKEDAVQAALREVVRPTRAEPGCLEMHAFRARRDRRLFYIHSRWRDDAAFDLHATLPHTRRFLEQVDPLLDQPREAARVEIID